MDLSLKDSINLKGIALIMLLIHHLFYVQNGLFDEIRLGNHEIIRLLALGCKACVPLFVILSGYGLTAVALKEDKLEIGSFYLKRFKKLFFNYWFIWLIFVPIGLFFFDRSFSIVYGQHCHLKLMLDLFGLLNFVGCNGYNATWWFYSCIIFFYLCFPYIFYLCKKWNLSFMVFFSIGILIPFIENCIIIEPFKYYFISFIIGILLKLFNIKDRQRKLQSINMLRGGVIALLIMSSIYIRQFISFALLFDTITAFLIIMGYCKLRILFRNSKILNILGRHSFNIFLFHTFIYYYYFKELIYISREPLLIFFSLIVSCLLISYALEFTKKVIIKLLQKIKLKALSKTSTSYSFYD